MAVEQRDQLDADGDRPEWLVGYTDPVVVLATRHTTRVHEPDRSSECVAPRCREWIDIEGRCRDSATWRVRERAAVDGDRCRDCCGGKAEHDGNTERDCPLCGETVFKTKLPQHLPNCPER